MFSLRKKVVMSDLELQKVLKEVHANHGSMNDLTKHFTEAEVTSEEFKKTKQAISQKLTDLRSSLKKKCEEQGLPVENVFKVIPKLGGGRQSPRQSQLDEIFAMIVEAD